MQQCSYAWRGCRGVGKRTRLLQFLEIQSNKMDVPFKMKNVFILTTNLLLDNKLLMIEEQYYLSIFKKWKDTNIKNEINDNAQIQLTLELMRYFKNKKGLIISHDKMMCNKVKNVMTSISNLYILESHDFKL